MIDSLEKSFKPPIPALCTWLVFIQWTHVWIPASSCNTGSDGRVENRYLFKFRVHEPTYHKV